MVLCVVVYGVLWFISMHPHGFIGTDHRWWISELRSIIWHFSDHCGQKMFLGVIYPTVWMVQLECDNTLNLKMILKVRRFGLSHGAWKNLFQTSQCLNRNLWSYIVQYLTDKAIMMMMVMKCLITTCTQSGSILSMLPFWKDFEKYSRDSKLRNFENLVPY